MKICNGDKVKIISDGPCYTTYRDFFDLMSDYAASYLEKVKEQYIDGHSPDSDELNTTFTVIFMHPHTEMTDRLLAVVNNGEHTYIVDVNGLEFVSTDRAFNVGDTVRISDPGHVYSAWDTVVKTAASCMPNGEEVKSKFFTGDTPGRHSDFLDKNNPLSKFTVMWIGPHMTRPDTEDHVVVIYNGVQTFVMGADGLQSCMFSAEWAKYITYIHNWAVMHRNDDGPSSPKSFTLWLTDKNSN